MNQLKNIMELIYNSVPPIHKEGHTFIFIFAAVSLFLGSWFEPLGWIGLMLTIWCAYFFRDPERVTPIGDDLVISPADGVVQKIEQVMLPQELGIGREKVTRISVFLNVFNVHVNRVPISGEVTQMNYHPGQFMSANLDKASEENERQSVVIANDKDQQVVCIQIAGLVARRIVCTLEDGQKVKGGERLGLIRFGSRVDVYLPENVPAKVVVGQTAIAGETILADLSQEGEDIQGEVR